MNTLLIRVITTLALTSSVFRAEAQTEILPRGFLIRTGRLEARFEDGVITGIRSLVTGEVHAEFSRGSRGVPRGMSTLAAGAAAMRSLHLPWSTRPLPQNARGEVAVPSQHFADSDSIMSLEPIPGGMRATWRDLSDGSNRFPGESLSVEAWQDPGTGQLLVRATGHRPDAGVVGIQVPIANLHAKHRIYVPSFGGVFYDASDPQGLTTLGTAPFLEAATIAIESPTGSTLGLWVEDPTFAPYFYFQTWNGASFSASLQHLNIMPFEKLDSVTSTVWRLDAFAGGWVDAMAPYRDWYERSFKTQLDQRNRVAWAHSIAVILDEFLQDSETLALVKRMVPVETVLLHEWNARSAAFGHDLPDWTPRPSYLRMLDAAHALGFRVMAYVNTYCANVGSKAFQDTKVDEIGLTRPIDGIWEYGKAPVTFDSAKPGSLLYLDPLAPQWRSFHVNSMRRWVAETSTDANYEDVGGTAGDFGNGEVDGLRGAEGGTAQFKALLEKLPGTPMASEFAPDHMAFASHWPLRYQQTWGSDTVRSWWMTRQRPISAYIHAGTRAWIPTVNAETEFLRHVVVACSDALGGLAQFKAVPHLLASRSGLPLHMLQRAVLFARRSLRPHFPTGLWPADLACCYQDSSGALLRYRTQTDVQTMEDSHGRPLYQRVIGRGSIESPLRIAGWPALSGNTTIGLNPSASYALGPGKDLNTPVRIHALPDGIILKRFDVNARRTVLVLDRGSRDAPTRGAVSLSVQTNVLSMWINHARVQPPQSAEAPAPTEYSMDFPSSILLLTGETDSPRIDEVFAQPSVARFFSAENGIERGSLYPIKSVKLWKSQADPAETPFMFLNGGDGAELSLDYLFQVPSTDSAIQVDLRNTQNQFGDGTKARVLINGMEILAEDLGPKSEAAAPASASQNQSWDTDIHRWSIPVGHYSGQAINLTLLTNPKMTGNADELWWGSPRLVRSSDTRPCKRRLGPPESDSSSP